MNTLLNWLKPISLLACALLMACEAPYVGPPRTEEPQPNVIFRISSFEQIAFPAPQSRAFQEISEVCTRINLVVFKDGEKVTSVVQKAGDENFGVIGLNLPPDNYQVAIICHNSDGTATVSSLDKITFKNNLVTDTHLYYDDFTASDETVTYDVQVHRVVAMFRFELKEPLPAEAKQLKFYYTGGSSTLSAISGYGSVNSRQTVVLDVASDHQTYEVYTFPHDETGELKMTVSVLDASNNVLFDWVLESVPVTRNRITKYVGELYQPQSPGAASTFVLKADPEWDGEDTYTGS